MTTAQQLREQIVDMAVTLAQVQTKRGEPVEVSAVQWLLDGRQRGRHALVLLARWLDTQRDTTGGLNHHYPIDQDGVPDWGCNVCGLGWPCLADEARRLVEL